MKRKSTRLIGNSKIELEEEITYTDIIPSQTLVLDEVHRLVFSVSSQNGEEPHLDIRTFIETPKYSGATKKGINLHIENIEEFRAILRDMDNQLEKLGY